METDAKNRRGPGRTSIVAVIVVLLVAVSVGWIVWQKNKENTSQQEITNTQCSYNDEDLCKFFANWKNQAGYEYKGTTERTDGAKIVSVVRFDNGRLYMKLDGPTSYEVIQIDNILYAKASDGTWWKQTLQESELNKYKDEGETNLTEPASQEEYQNTYQKIGQEDCDGLTCLKYRVSNPNDTTTSSFIWFDDRDHRLRRIQTSSAEYTFDATYTYDNISVNEPFPIKELGPGQNMVPIQDESVTLPRTGG